MKGYTRLYRFEQKNNSEVGPYKMHHWEGHTVDNGRPPPYQDEHVSGVEVSEPYLFREILINNGVDVKKILFGFKTKALIKKWFNTKERRRLDALGFVLRTYHVPTAQMVVFAKQVMFNNKYAVVAI